MLVPNSRSSGKSSQWLLQAEVNDIERKVNVLLMSGAPNIFSLCHLSPCV